MKAKWTVQYQNDVGPDDDGFWEWWEVTSPDGKFTYKANKEFEALTLAEAMNTKEGLFSELVSALENAAEWISDHAEEMPDGNMNSDAVLDDIRSVLRKAKP